ncbi:helix-turn-helix domain-containing protein [Paenibacillus cremeus]|uniref:AraC family transcriptional regulator n=1 Tax=Paenibacillus cremeus TaxID=2163881 RepID=A0A559KIP1_9BACL|nr:helix-turn-helix domain-containing protein [Paenibacillus cremeus]TVY12007.1 AraC family transcriptional regulator [Paenibacillus cremeus]
MLSLIRLAFSNFKFRSLFFRILCWFVIVSIVPALCIGYFSGRFSQSSVQDEVNRSSIQMLEQTRRLMDLLLNNVDQVAIQLAQSKALQNPASSTDLADKNLDSVKEYLLETYINSPYIESIYVYYAGTEMVQSPLTYSPVSEAEDAGWLPYYKELKKKDGTWIVRENPASDEGRNGFPNLVTLIRPFPLTGTEKLGAIIINLNQQALFQTPSLRLMRPEEEIWTVSPDGHYAYSNKDGLKVNERDFSVIQPKLGSDVMAFSGKLRGTEFAFTSVTSPYTGWKYIDVIPNESFYSRSRELQTFIILLAASCIVVAIGLAFVTSIRIYTPIYTLMEFVRSRAAGKQGFKPVEHGEISVLFSEFTRLFENRTQLEQQVYRDQPVLRQSFLNLILHERTSRHEERWERFAYYNIPVARYGFFVTIFRIDNYPSFVSAYNNTDQSLIRYFIAKLAEEVAAEHWNSYSLNTESTDILLICNLREAPPSLEALRMQMEETMRVVCGNVRQYLKLTVSAGLGDWKSDPGDISLSFEEAKEALELRVFQGYASLNAIWRQRRTAALGSALKPVQQAKKELYRQLNERNDALLKESLRQLEYKLVSMEGHSYQLIRHAVFQLFLELYERAVELGLEPVPEAAIMEWHQAFMNRETVEQLIHCLGASMTELQQRVERSAAAEPPSIGKQIADYVQANYAHDISLGGIADQLQMDPSYVSRLFKQEFQVNFLDYLISVRMAKAKQLLQETDMSVKDIGTAVGYTNQRSFNRIFKKAEGVAPSQYRESLVPQRLNMDEIY